MARAAALSRHFFEHSRLESAQILEDGFQDAGPCTDPTLEGSSRVVVDRNRDDALQRFLERCRKKLRKAKDEPTQVMVAALLVSDTCGGSGAHAADLLTRHARLVSEQRHSETGEVLIGTLTGERITGAARRGKHPPMGAALVPYRALLFKALADFLGLLTCTLQRRSPIAGEKPRPLYNCQTWNVVQIEKTLYVVDILFDPGALYEQNSAKAQEYFRLLSENEAAIANGEKRVQPPAPASRKDLGGHMPRPDWHVEPWELEIQRSDRIGRGGFGEVFHGRWAAVHVAVKEIKDTTPTDADVVDFMLEIALLSQLNHPNIVRFWRGCVENRGESRSLLMVTEYVRQGGLSRLLHGHGGAALPEPLTLSQALSFGLDIARGTQYLHSQRILHLDLKSPNVLCARPWTAKLCDFGLAKMRGEQTVVQSTLQGVSPVWAPPEMFDEKVGGLSEKADVYSFAVIFFELLTKQVPFQEVNAAQLPALKAAGRCSKIPSSVPDDCADLIKQCWAAKPDARPSMSGVVARLRDIAQGRNLRLSEVKPPASMMRGSDGQEQQVKEAEEIAAAKLVELDGQRAQLRVELASLQKLIQAARRKGTELAAASNIPEAEETGTQEEPKTELNEAMCDAFIQEIAGEKFRCTFCSKLFRGTDFVRRHIMAKHQAEVLKFAQDQYFDCDVSNEDAMPEHMSMPIKNLQSLRLQSVKINTLGAGFTQTLQDAVQQGSVEQIVALLERRADATQKDDAGVGPLMVAARSGHKALIDLLLVAAKRQGADEHDMVCRTSGAGLTALHFASSEGHVEAVSEMVQRRAIVDATCALGKTPLMLAGENGHEGAMELLIKAKADPCSKTPDSETLLHVVARFGDAALIEKVLSWKANLLAEDRDGWTPLHEAAHWSAAAVEALCKANANVATRSSDGETPMHVALEGYEQTLSVEVLLRYKADPMAPDVDGETPLHLAVRRNALDASRLLLNSRAEANAADHAGRVPLALAHRPEIEELLKQSGAIEVSTEATEPSK